MKWTRESPKENGYYWHMPNDGKQHKPVIVNVLHGKVYNHIHSFKALLSNMKPSYWCKIDIPEWGNKCPYMHCVHGDYLNTCEYLELNNAPNFHCDGTFENYEECIPKIEYDELLQGMEESSKGDKNG